MWRKQLPQSLFFWLKYLSFDGENNVYSTVSFGWNTFPLMEKTMSTVQFLLVEIPFLRWRKHLMHLFVSWTIFWLRLWGSERFCNLSSKYFIWVLWYYEQCFSPRRLSSLFSLAVIALAFRYPFYAAYFHGDFSCQIIGLASKTESDCWLVNLHWCNLLGQPQVTFSHVIFYPWQSTMQYKD